MTIYYIAALLITYKLLMYWIKRQAQERRERQAELISSMKNTPNEEDRD